MQTFSLEGLTPLEKSIVFEEMGVALSNIAVRLKGRNYEKTNQKTEEKEVARSEEKEARPKAAVERADVIEGTFQNVATRQQAATCKTSEKIEVPKKLKNLETLEIEELVVGVKKMMNKHTDVTGSRNRSVEIFKEMTGKTLVKETIDRKILINYTAKLSKEIDDERKRQRKEKRDQPQPASA